jgi:type IV pilus assembly protein PilW
MSARHRQQGLTLIEMMVALAIGTFLMAGTLTVFAKTRDLYRTNESAARLQENARYAMSTVEADLRLAGNWGLINRADLVENAVSDDEPVPSALSGQATVINACGARWAIFLERPVDGADGNYALDDASAACTAFGTASTTADVLTVRHARFTIIPSTDLSATNGQLKIQSSRVMGSLFTDTTVPTGFTGAESQTHALEVHSYYISQDSQTRDGLPSLRRKGLGFASGAATLVDEEIMHGVEDLQVEFGVDTDDDQNANFYIDPGADLETRLDAGNAIVSARVWLLLRADEPEVGFTDNRTYNIANRAAYTPNDAFRRVLVVKTVMLRNARR